MNDPDINTLCLELNHEITELKSTLATQAKEKKKQMHTHIENHTRPALSAKANTDDIHQKAIDAYVRRGDEVELREVALEGKSMSMSVNADGGFLVDPMTAEKITSALYGASSLRSVANVVQVEASAYDVLVDHGEFEAGWADENTPSIETSNTQFDRISIPLYELSALPKSSQRLLDDAAFNVEEWLATRIADKFSRSESAAFISGDGIDKPKGFLSHQCVENDLWEWGKIGIVKTGVNGDFDASNPADAIVDLVYALPSRYRLGANFVMNSKTAGAVRKMKDADGRFLWSDGLASEEPARLMGYKVLICEDMPDISEGSNAIAFGNFSAGYTIAERPDLRILRDPYSAKPHVLFYATKRVGGDVSDFAAIKLLSFDT